MCFKGLLYYVRWEKNRLQNCMYSKITFLFKNKLLAHVSPRKALGFILGPEYYVFPACERGWESEYLALPSVGVEARGGAS